MSRARWRLHGKRGLVDDSIRVAFEHFGSLRWITQTPESFKRDVHGIAPPWSQLAEAFGGGDVAEVRPHRRERAARHPRVSALALEPANASSSIWMARCGRAYLAGDRIAVRARIRRPDTFWRSWARWGFAGLYRGIHEALKALKDRGILLACVEQERRGRRQEAVAIPERASTRRC